MVFKTITENVKSFFQKEEDLEQQPRRLKDAAVEVFEKPGSEHHIVAHKLQGAPMLQQQAQPKPPQKLPFSSEQLRQRLQQPTAQPPTRAAPKIQQRPQISDEDISSQIVEFEQAITTIPGEDGSSLPLSVPPKVAAKLAKTEQSPDGYFTQFAQFLRQKGYDVDDALLEEALAKMKQHHEHRLVVEKHKEKALSLEEQLSHKLSELQELEREWASRQEDIAIARERSADLEEVIARRTTDLRQLVATMRQHASQAPPPQSPSLPVTQSRPNPPEPQPVSLSPPIIASPPPLHSREEAPMNVLPAQPPITPPVAMAAPPLPPPLSSDPPLPSLVAAPSSQLALSVSSAPQLPLEKRFFLHNGRSLSSLVELRDALLVMDDALFYYHVTPQRNDFVSWIRGVFGDERLAERALHANNKYDFARLLSP